MALAMTEGGHLQFKNGVSIRRMLEVLRIGEGSCEKNGCRV